MPLSYYISILSVLACINCVLPTNETDNSNAYSKIIIDLYLKINWIMLEVDQIKTTVTNMDERQNNTKLEENINAVNKDIMEMKQEIFQKFDQQENTIKTDNVVIKQELFQKFDQHENWMTNSSDAIKKDIMEIKQELFQKLNQQENRMTNSSDAIKTDILDIKQEFLQKFNQQEHLLTKSSTAIENFMGKNFNTTMEIYDTTMKGFNTTIIKMLKEEPLKPMRNWLVILRRQDGSENFDRNWLDYKNGFGHQNGEFFIGLDKLHAITTYGEAQELLFVLKDFENQTRYAKYDNFVVGNESEKYKIKQIGKYYGDVGDKFSNHLNFSFSTKDKYDDNNCAKSFIGGWWFQNCYNVHLTGRYFDEHTPNGDLGIIWSSFHHSNYSLK